MFGAGSHDDNHEVLNVKNNVDGVASPLNSSASGDSNRRGSSSSYTTATKFSRSQLLQEGGANNGFHMIAQEGSGSEEEEEMQAEEERARIPNDGSGSVVVKRIGVLKKVFRLANPDSSLYIIGVIALFLSVGVNLVLPYSLGSILGDATPNTVFLDVVKITFIYMAVYLVGALMTSIRIYCFISAGENLVHRIRSRLYAAILSQQMFFFDQTRSGELLTRISTDCDLIQHTATITFAQAFRFIIQIVGGAVFLLYLSWQMTLVLLSVAPIMGVGAFIYSKTARKLGRQLQDSIALNTSVANEVLHGIRHVLAFAREDYETRRFQEHLDNTRRIGKRVAVINSRFMGSAEFGSYAAVLLVILFGAYLIISGELSSSFVTSYILYSVYVSHALGALSHLAADLARSTAAAERVLQLLSALSCSSSEDSYRGEAGRGHQISSQDMLGALSFEDVSLKYSGQDALFMNHANKITARSEDHAVTNDGNRAVSSVSVGLSVASMPISERTILRKVSFQIAPRQTVALVGPSGAGKSSILQLLLKFYLPYEGEIKIDGKSISDLDTHWLRENIGYVSQEPTLFCSTIRDNIRYGKLDATQNEIEQAAKVALIHDYIMSLEHGYDTVLIEKGSSMSGGQKQRIAIARVVLKNAPIILMDEPTSALDAESERLVQDALENLYQHRTCLIVTHRLELIRKCSSILVFNKGELVEQGVHEELLQNDGVYAKLFQLQHGSSVD